MEILFAILIVLLTTIGQILLKKGAIYHQKIKSLQLIALGYILFLFTIGFSYMLMKLIPMKYFTIIMSLNYISVMFAAKIFLNEKLDQKKIIGTILITVGIIIFMIDTTIR